MFQLSGFYCKSRWALWRLGRDAWDVPDRCQSNRTLKYVFLLGEEAADQAPAFCARGVCSHPEAGTLLRSVHNIYITYIYISTYLYVCIYILV